MRKKVAYGLMLLSILLVVSAAYNSAAAAPNYQLVGVKVGNTADYSIVIGNSTYTFPDTRLHLSVFSINGALVTFNSTYYFSNGTVDPETDKSFQVNVTYPHGFFDWTSLVAANLSAHDSIYQGSTATINETTSMIVAGANRTVNHFSIANGQVNLYWDKPTGIMVKMNFNFIQWLNYTMTSTNMWSGGGLPMELILVGGVAAVVIVAAAALLLRRRK